jgi:hypothetical protein
VPSNVGVQVFEADLAQKPSGLCHLINDCGSDNARLTTSCSAAKNAVDTSAVEYLLGRKADRSDQLSAMKRQPPSP